MDVCYQISSRLNIKFCHQSAILDFLLEAISREIFELSIWIFFTDWYQIWNMYCWISRQSKIQYGRKGIILDFLSATKTSIINWYPKGYGHCRISIQSQIQLGCGTVILDILLTIEDHSHLWWGLQFLRSEKDLITSGHGVCLCVCLCVCKHFFAEVAADIGTKFHTHTI